MSAPTYVVMPVQSGSGKHSEPDTDRIASEIQQSLNGTTRPEDRNGQGRRDSGPLKEIIAHQDSLYKYISWEDPVRTVGTYIGALSILCGAHYIPLTQYALKAAATTLGMISVVEFASRSFGPNTFLARLRPKEYKQVPEQTLNATLKDIHDFVQYAVVQAQKIIWAQDLENTIAACLGFTVLFWLIKVVPPFWVAVLGLTSLYMAPLVYSPRSREIAHDGMVRAQELTSAAAQKGSTLARDGVDKAGEVSSVAREAAVDTGRGVAGLAQNGLQTVAGMATQAKNKTSDVSEASIQNVRKLPEMGTDAVNQAPGIVNSVLGRAEQ